MSPHATQVPYGYNSGTIMRFTSYGRTFLFVDMGAYLDKG
jgi:hypothetical protein